MRYLLALSCCLALATPARASTIPPAELPAGRTTVELGFGHSAFDRALSDRLQVGAMAWWFWPMVRALAVRGGYRLIETPHVSIAGLLSAGITSTNADPNSLGVTRPWDTRTWLQPALNVSVSLLPPDAWFDLRLRSTVGPIVNLSWFETRLGGTTAQPPGLFDPLLWPNVELAFQFGRTLEFTAGYPDLVSLRATW